MSIFNPIPLDKEAFSTIPNCPIIQQPTINKIKEAGILTLQQLAFTPDRQLMDITGMGEDTAKKMTTLARKVISPDFIDGEQLYERQKSTLRMSTGSSTLDALFSGGVETGAITEIAGEFGSGKSQFAYTVAVLTTQRETKNHVILIDTEGTTKIERLLQIADERGLDRKKIFSNTHVARAYNSDHQWVLVNSLNSETRKYDVGLIIVDSIIAHLRSEFTGRGTLAERQQRLSAILRQLLAVAGANGIAVIITNQVQSKPDSFFGGDPNKPVGGHIIGHLATYRTIIRKGRGNTRKLEMVDSSYIPQEKVRIAITEAGVVDEDGSYPNYVIGTKIDYMPNGVLDEP